MNVEPHRRSFTSCDIHPNEQFTGFCTSCLREKLIGLEAETRPRNSSSSSTSGLKSIFRAGKASSSSSSALLPELRRCQSFSVGRREMLSGVFEPQRRSCDVRAARNTLSSLFHLDDECRRGEETEEMEGEKRNLGIQDVGNAEKRKLVLQDVGDENRKIGFRGVVGEESWNLGFQGVNGAENRKLRFQNMAATKMMEGQGELKVPGTVEVKEILEEKEEQSEVRFSESVELGDIVEEDENRDEEQTKAGVKTMKEHIELDSQNSKTNADKNTMGSTRDFKEIAGSFWLAASVFSKKLQKWRRKQKMKKQRNSNETDVRLKKQFSSHFQDLQSEYGLRRRSCDAGPRFSLDAGRDRILFDDPRCSWEEPRASWDGYLIGRPMNRPSHMFSVIEDPPVQRIDNLIPLEDSNDFLMISRDSISEASSSSQRRSQKLERSSSIHRMVENEDMKIAPNEKVTEDLRNRNKLPNVQYEFKDLNFNSLRDDSPEIFESTYIDAGFMGECGKKRMNKSRRWKKAWNIWGLIHRRNNKEENVDRYKRGNLIERTFAEPWPALSGGENVEYRGAFGRKLRRSSSNVSSRSSFSNVGIENIKRNKKEMNKNSSRRRGELIFGQNCNLQYSPPSHFDNGFVRFYLTPPSGSEKNSKKASKRSNYFSRSILGY